MKLLLLTLLLLTPLLLSSCGRSTVPPKTQNSAWIPGEGAELIGQKAPEFSGLTWVNNKPMTLSALRGKPVFIRFWLGDCPMCRQSVRALNYLQKTYGKRGLVVIGIHHPKITTSLESADKLTVLMNQWGIDFPVAMDNDWKTIRKYWVNKDREFTSGSMLIDRKGYIRWVHPGGVLGLPPSLGGDYASPAYESLQRSIEDVLSD